MSDFQRIGFIGTGVMGQSMAGHLLDGGHELFVFNRTKARAEALLKKGAVWCQSPAEMAPHCAVIITMVGFPQDVEAVYLGDSGILNHVREGTLLLDMTTSSPALAKRIAEKAASRGCEALDAPVSGGDLGARNAALSIMCGGSDKAYAQALPILRQMGKTLVHQGPPGSGQHCKMANQICIAAGMMGVCEALAYATKSGLDPETVLASISGGAAGSWSLSNLAPRMLNEDWEPGFYIKHFIKDLRIALDSAKELQVKTPGLELALSLYKQLAERGLADEGTQALFKWYCGAQAGR